MNFQYLNKNIPTSTGIMIIVITLVFFLGIFGWQQGLITEFKKSILIFTLTLDLANRSEDNRNEQEDLPAVVAEAKQDLAATLKIDASQITIKELESTMWRNGCLGCAKEGQMCTQALVPGYRAVLSYQQNEYEYHTSQNHFVFCESTK